MYRRFDTMHGLNKNTFLQAGLSLVWIAGLSLGLMAARSHGDALRACVLLAPGIAPTFWGCLTVNVLPLLISACAVCFLSSFVFPLCFLRGLCLGLGLGAVAAGFGRAGGMMLSLLLFGMLLFSPVLLWYWFRRAEHGRSFLQADTCICALIGVALALGDMWIVSPFVREVMNF